MSYVSPMGACIRCGTDVSFAWREADETRLVADTVRLRDGRTAVWRNNRVAAVYCSSCASNLRVCRMCGCTEEVGCRTENDSCFWIEPDLCSQCHLPEEYRFLPPTLGERSFNR